MPRTEICICIARREHCVLHSSLLLSRNLSRVTEHVTRLRAASRDQGGGTHPTTGGLCSNIRPPKFGGSRGFFPVQPTTVAKSAKNRPAMQRSAKFLAVAGDILFAVAARRREAPGCSKKKGACSRDSHTKKLNLRFSYSVFFVHRGLLRKQTVLRRLRSARESVKVSRSSGV